MQDLRLWLSTYFPLSLEWTSTLFLAIPSPPILSNSNGNKDLSLTLGFKDSKLFPQVFQHSKLKGQDFFFYFNRRIIALQRCIGFCHKTTWISPPPPHHTPHRALGSAPCVAHQLHTGCVFYTWWWTHFNAAFSVHPTLSFPHCVHRSVLCVSVPTLQIGFITALFLDPIYMRY